MITETDLINMGYIVKTRLTDKEKTVDFKHPDSKNRPYLVNLNEGEINIVYPNNYKHGEFFRTDNLDEFKNWHNGFRYRVD